MIASCCCCRHGPENVCWIRLPSVSAVSAAIDQLAHLGCGGGGGGRQTTSKRGEQARPSLPASRLASLLASERVSGRTSERWPARQPGRKPIGCFHRESAHACATSSRPRRRLPREQWRATACQALAGGVKNVNKHRFSIGRNGLKVLVLGSTITHSNCFQLPPACWRQTKPRR